MSEIGQGYVWPEQEAVDAWLKENGLALDHEKTLGLKKAVSAERLRIQRENENLKQALSESNGVIESVKKALSPPPDLEPNRDDQFEVAETTDKPSESVIEITEQTLTELVSGSITAREKGMKKALIRSPWSHIAFRVSLEQTPNSQESLGYRLA